MRLKPEEIELLKKALQSLDQKAKVYLFGSRTDDSKRGGDIDLLIVSNSLTQKDLRKLRIEFFNHFGEQKIDIVLDNEDINDPFTKHIMQKAILL